MEPITCKHCNNPITLKGGLWFDNDLMLPRYCYRNTINGSGPHEPSTSTKRRSTSKYILLRGLLNNNCFFTSVEKEGDDPTTFNNGEVGYEIIGYADTVKEAQIKLYGYSSTNQDY